VAAYRAARRAAGKDSPRQPRTVDTDGHVSNVWFRNNVWNKALEAAGLGFRVTPHGLRHAHASWLLAGGADSRSSRNASATARSPPPRSTCIPSHTPATPPLRH
jgi:integrase